MKTELKWIRANLIDPPPENEFKHSPASIEQLAENIKEIGLLHPLVVTKSKDGRYEVIAGERRFRALVEYLGWEKIPCQVFTGENEVSKTKKRVSENFYRDTYDFVTEAEAAYNLYQAGVSIKDMMKLWGVKSSDVPSQLVVIGRYLRVAPKVALHDKLRNLLLHVRGGRDTVASVIAAFTEQHGGYEESELPEEAVPVITGLFQAAVAGDWEPERLLAEAKAKARELALERAQAALQEAKEKAWELASEELRAEWELREEEWRAQLAELEARYEEETEQLRQALEQAGEKDKEQIAALQARLDALRKQYEEERKAWEAKVQEDVERRLREALREKANELRRKLEEEEKEKLRREKEELERRKKTLEYREQRLKVKEAEFAEGIRKFHRTILQEAASLRKALQAASSTSILSSFTEKEVKECLGALMQVEEEIQEFIDLLREVKLNGEGSNADSEEESATEDS